MKYIKKDIIAAYWFGLPTDGSSDEDDKFLPTLIKHFGEDSGFVETLLDMPDINSCSAAEQMFETCDNVIKSFSLDWNNCVSYSSDNTNSMIGKRNSVLKRITNVQCNEKTFDVGGPYHLAHLCAGKVSMLKILLSFLKECKTKSTTKRVHGIQQ